MNKFKKEMYINQRYSKKTNSWSFQVIIRTENGTITETFNEKRYGSARRAYDEAVIFRNKKLIELNNGIRVSNVNKTLTEVFYETFSVFPVREETKRKHAYYYMHYMRRDIPIKNVTKAMIVQSLNSMINDNSDDGINRALSVWRRIYKTAIINEYVAYDQTIGIVAPKSQTIPKAKREVVTTRETLDKVEEKVNETFSEESAKSLIMALETMWYCGLRPCECFALNVDDIQGGYINVNKELGTDIADDSKRIIHDGEIIIRKCKTQASIRKVPIPKNLQDLYDNYKVDGTILFPKKNGGYFNVAYVGTRLRKFNLNFNMYQLRHTVATHLITSGVDQRTIIEIMGHENIDMSIYYARSNDELKKRALDNR